MRKAHYITLAVALGLIALLYWGAVTVPPKKHDKAAVPGQAGSQMPQQQAVATISFDSILSAARQQLPVHAQAEVDSVEKEIRAIRDSARMAPVFTRLGDVWKEHQQLPIAAYYYATNAKLENSEKKLNFAGQFFLDLMYRTGSPGLQAWEAQQAIACFQRSLELNPANDTAKIALASGYIDGTGETMQGVQVLLGVTREKPDNIPANLILGRLAVQSGQFDKAIQRMETVLSQDTENTEALYFQAEAYKGKGDKKKAIELFEKCKRVVNKPEFSKDIDQYINSFK